MPRRARPAYDYPPSPPPPHGFAPGPPPAWSPNETFIYTDRSLGHLPEFKRVVQEYDPKTRKWTTEEVEQEPLSDDESLNEITNELNKFCFIFRRQIKPQGKDLPPMISEFIEINSYFIRKACLEVIGTRNGISWNASFLQLMPNQLLGYYPEFREYLSNVFSTPMSQRTEDDEQMINHLGTILDFLGSEYKKHLAELEDLAKNQETTFGDIFALYKPGRLYVMKSVVTGEPQIVRLLTTWTGQALTVESLDIPTAKPVTTTTTAANTASALATGHAYIWKTEQVLVNTMSLIGRVQTTTLALYPLEHHPEVDEFKEKLTFRGRKWRDLIGVHLKFYDGIAIPDGKSGRIGLYDRVMIDRVAYDQRLAATSNPYGTPQWGAPPGNDWAPIPPPADVYNPTLEPPKGTDEDLLLAPSHVYGFSFTDKRWFTFLVENLQPVRWDPLAFEQLSMEMERKALLQSLVEYHNKPGATFKDIVARKGRGLVVNLFGPPGTGKTLTAEAISEYVRKPLYSITAGDLGSYAYNLSDNLNKIFTLCSKWDAIVLLDEADIFLEARSNHEIERNAMVSVFLKELEYFEGIIFLTTNRIETFDPAFQSRIHVSLRYEPLSFRSRKEVWISLLQRTGFGKDSNLLPLTDNELNALAETEKNGREIRNIVRTAEAVAASRGESLGYRHLVQVKGVSNAFEVGKTEQKSEVKEVSTVSQNNRLSGVWATIYGILGPYSIIIAMMFCIWVMSRLKTMIDSERK